MVTKPVGRKAIFDDKGRRRSDLAPSGRGFTSVSLRDEVNAKLLAYMRRHSIATKAGAVEHLLDHAPAKE